MVTAQRRDAGGIDILRALTLVRTEPAGTRRTLLERPADWFAALDDVFGLRFDDLTASERDGLWARVQAQHEAWLAEHEQ